MTNLASPAALSRGDFDARAWVDRVAVFIMAGVALLNGYFCIGRERFNFGLESDFIGRFVPEAQRFLALEPLVVDIHPPGYPIVLATVNSLIGDWHVSGWLVSWLASVAVILCCWRLFLRIGGSWAGLGAVGLLATSVEFLAFSIQAGSDMLFLALFFASLLAVAVAMTSKHRWPWALGGLLAGLTILMRANGVIMLLLALAPLLMPLGARERVFNGALFVAGVVLPIVLWAGFATETQSPIFPTETHSNLAMTFYGDRGTAPHDQRVRMAREFDSSLDVLLADPVHVARIYIIDLVKLPGRIVLNAGWVPLAILAALCLLYVAPWMRSAAGIVVLSITTLSILLINMMHFQPRFYMHVTPVLGAALGMVVSEWLLRTRADGRRTALALTGLCAAILAGAVPAAIAARDKAEPAGESREIADVVDAVRAHVPDGTPIVARKNLISFYTGRPLIWFPEAATLGEVCTALTNDEHGVRRVYLVIGGAERRIRKEVAAQVFSGRVPPWVRIVESGGPVDARWALAELALADCRHSDSRSNVTPPREPADGRTDDVSRRPPLRMDLLNGEGS